MERSRTDIRGPTADVLKSRYEELNSCIWKLLDIYVKWTGITLAIISVAFAYLIKVDLDPVHSRVISFIVILGFAEFYTCNAWGLLVFKSLMRNIEQTATDLAISFDLSQYIICKRVMIASMIFFFPIMCVFVWFFVRPPTIPV